jgi:serine/threonine protein kinase
MGQCAYTVEESVNEDAKDLISRLLCINPALRLGMLASGEQDLFQHALCKHIDMQKLLLRQIKLPYVPQLNGPTDTSLFDACAEPGGGKQFDKYLDPKLEELWEKEFGLMPP